MIRRLGKGVVGIADNGTVFVTDEKAERELKDRGIKAVRTGRVIKLGRR
jgi:hypothetical protein